MTTKKFKSFQEFTDQVGNDPAIQESMRTDPVGTLNQVKIIDKMVYRIALWILGAVVIMVIAGTLFYINKDKETPEFLMTLASTSLGAIAGLISQTT